MQLGKQRFRFLFLATALAATGLSACKKDVENTTPLVAASPSVVDVIASSADYSILSAAIQKTNLTALLSSNAQFTFLAPNNAAFGSLAAPYNSVAAINALDPAVAANATQITALQNILLYHIISGKYQAANLPATGTTSQRTPAAAARRDNTLFFPRIGGALLINSTTAITQPDIEAVNGYVQGIGQILTPPATTFYGLITAAATNTVVANQQFVLLKQAIDQQNTQALLQSPPVAPLLSFLNTDQTVPLSNGQLVNYTFFAPTDAALQAYLTAQGYASIKAVPFATLTALLRRHLVLNARVFNAELATGRQLTNAAGGTLTIGGSGSAFTVTNSTNNTTAAIAPSGSFASNGTFYTIDKVL